MTTKSTGDSTAQRPLRLWPGVIAAVLLGLVRFGLPLILPSAAIFALLGALGCGVIVVLWWTFFSRAPIVERLIAIPLMIVSLVATRPILHESVRAGMMGMLFFIHAIPILCLALAAWAVLGRGLSKGVRRASMVAAIVFAGGLFALVRTEGVTGDSGSEFKWRWTKTAEEQLLAQTGDEPAAFPAARPTTPAAANASGVPSGDPAGVKPGPVTPAPVVSAPVVSAPAATALEWPGFRGSNRDGTARGVRIETDWSKFPPVELWRRPVGPGWSSMSVSGGLLYTQEQRGSDEIVSAYSVTTGKPVWRHRDAARFWESNGGAGPRATPTLSNGRVYTLGGTGILNALDAGTGAVVWTRNAASDTNTKVPIWGFAGSPLVIDDLVVVAVSGAIVAYDVASGSPRWQGPAGVGGYSSPHPATIDGIAQLLFLNGAGVISVASADGKLLWEHKWPDTVPILQPAMLADGNVLIGVATATGGVGLRRLSVARGPGGWTVDERWTSAGLKPYFNDFVVHDGHAFGFDGSILACIDLADGKRMWKGGRYGYGQLILLADQALMIVLSEEGEIALVKAASDQFTELARLPAIEGKTWNHPVLIGDVLLVRNDREMAAFRLTRANR